MEILSEIFNYGIPVLITLGVFIFLYGLISFIFVKDEGKKRSRKKIMGWGFMIALLALLAWFVVAVATPTMGPQPVPDGLIISEDPFN